LNPHRPFGPADFKSAASANFAIRALRAGVMRARQAQVILSSLPRNTTILQLQLDCAFFCERRYTNYTEQSRLQLRAVVLVSGLLVWCCDSTALPCA
jgi:hypothetical protein